MKKIAILILLTIIIGSLTAGVRVKLDAPDYYTGNSFYVTAEFSFDMSSIDRFFMDISFPEGVESVEIVNKYDWDFSKVYNKNDLIWLKSKIQFPASYPLVSSYIDGHTGYQNLKLKLKITPKKGEDVKIYYRGTWGEETIYETYPDFSLYVDQQGWYVNYEKVELRPDLIVSDLYTNNPDNSYVGDQVKITAEITDRNKSNIDNVKLEYYLNGILIGDNETSSLTPEDNSDKESLYHYFDKSGINEIKVIVDPDDDIRESNEDNNESTITVYVKSNNNNPTISFLKTPKQNNVFNDLYISWIGSDLDGTIQKYEYEINGDLYTTTNDEITFQGLENGNYTFRVRSIDNLDAESNWVSCNFSVSVVKDVLVVLDNSSPLDIVSFLNVSAYNYETIQLNQLNTSSIDFSNIGVIITSLETYQKISNSQIKEKPVIILTKESQFNFNDDISINYTSHIFEFKYKEMPAPIAGYIDFDKELTAYSLGEELTGAFASPSITLPNTIITMLDYISDDKIEWATVSFVGEVSGYFCIASLGSGVMPVAILACVIKAVTMVGLSLEKGGYFEAIKSRNEDYYHDLRTSKLYYPEDRTIDCEVYYEYCTELGYYGLKTDELSLLNYQNINLSSENGYFKIAENGLKSSGVISANSNGTELFFESADYIVTKDLEIETDISDNSFEYYNSSSKEPYYVKKFEKNDDFVEEMTLKNGILYAHEERDTSSSDADFVIDSKGTISKFKNIEIKSNIQTVSEINNEIHIFADVEMEVGCAGIFQILIEGKNGVKAVEYETLDINQDFIKTYDISFKDLTSNPTIYNLYFQFRPDIVNGPLNTTEISDVINYMFDYQIGGNVTSINTIEKNNFLESVKLYPNPTSDNLYGEFVLKEINPITIDIYSINGILMKKLEYENPTAGLNKFFWKVPEEISNGIYIIQFRSENKHINERIMINKNK